jgi:hypothetical protein
MSQAEFAKARLGSFTGLNVGKCVVMRCKLTNKVLLFIKRGLTSSICGHVCFHLLSRKLIFRHIHVDSYELH